MKSYINAADYTELAIFECGREECVKDKAISLTKKDYHLFHYVLFGKGTLIINMKEYRLSKGSIFFIPPNTDAVYFPDREDPWVYEWVGFGGDKSNDFIEDLELSMDNPIIVDKNKQYKPFFDHIVSRYNEFGYSDISSLGALYQLLGTMLFDRQGRQVMPKSSLTVQLAKDFIRNNYQFNITIDDIAKNANVTPNYLSAIFQKEEEMTTKKYLTKVRMNNAMNLLTSGKLKIKEVATLVGYPNQLHFSSEFKKYYGESPIHYIKENIDE